MASTTQTTHYELPVYSGSDIASWTDTNTPFQSIDTAIYTAAQTASSAASDVSTLSSTVSGHTNSIATINTDISALQLADTNMDTRVGNIETTVGGHTTSIATNASNISANANAISDIEKDITDVEATNTASKAYSVGDTLIYDHDLYTVTAAISIGDTLAVGTNMAKTCIINYMNTERKDVLFTETGNEQFAGTLVSGVDVSKYRYIRIMWKSSLTFSTGYSCVDIPLDYSGGSSTVGFNMLGLLNTESTNDFVSVFRNITISNTGNIVVTGGVGYLNNGSGDISGIAVNSGTYAAVIKIIGIY